jgi:hypothetical protein
MDRLFMRSPIVLLFSILLLLGRCDQTPTSLEEEPFIPASGSETLSLDLLEFDFDPLSRIFFFSAAASSPQSGLQASYVLSSGQLEIAGDLLDNGLAGDIIANDGIFGANWQLPEVLETLIDSSWTLEIEAMDTDNELSVSRVLNPQRPNPPVIVEVQHADTLSLHASAWVVDTLTVIVTHPQGLDEIRDLSMRSLKPDGTYANLGNPIPLYDDGGSVVFYSFDGVDYTSGDEVAGDGIYSLLLILTPGNLSGTYHWEFTARSWLGIDSDIYLDSLEVLPASDQVASPGSFESQMVSGVFK